MNLRVREEKRKKEGKIAIVSANINKIRNLPAVEIDIHVAGGEKLFAWRAPPLYGIANIKNVSQEFSDSADFIDLLPPSRSLKCVTSVLRGS